MSNIIQFYPPCSHSDVVEFNLSRATGAAFRCVACGSVLGTIPAYVADALGMFDAVDAGLYHAQPTSEGWNGVFGIDVMADNDG